MKQLSHDVSLSIEEAKESRPRMTILLIEDSRLLRLAIDRILTRAGYTVIAVADGQEGLNRARDMIPELILLDMMLPTIEGTGVLRQLKKDPATKLIPVIVLSGLSMKNGVKLRAAGAAGYLEKSCLHLEKDGSVLLEAIKQVSSVASVPANA